MEEQEDEKGEVPGGFTCLLRSLLLSQIKPCLFQPLGYGFLISIVTGNRVILC